MKNYVLPVSIVLIAFICLLGCGPEPSEKLSSEMADEIALLPSEAGVMGYLNVQSIKKSPFLSFIEENMRDNPFYSDDYQEFMDATGMDIRNDIKEVYFAVNRGHKGDQSEMFAMIHGNFEPERIMDYLKEEDLDHVITEDKFGDYTIYRLKEEEFALCFVDNRRLIGGPINSVKNWLDKYDEGGDRDLSDQLKQRIQQLRYKHQAWMLMDTRSMMNEMLDEFTNQKSRNFQGLKSLQYINFSAKFDEKIQFYGIGQFDDETNAELFKDAAKGAIATAKLSMSEDRKAIDVLNKVKIEQDGPRMSVRFKMSKEDIDRLRQKREDLARY